MKKETANLMNAELQQPVKSIIKIHHVKQVFDSLGFSAVKDHKAKSVIVDSLTPQTRFLLVALILGGAATRPGMSSPPVNPTLTQMTSWFNTYAAQRHFGSVTSHSISNFVDQLETYGLLIKIGSSLFGKRANVSYIFQRVIIFVGWCMANVSSCVSLKDNTKYRMNIDPRQILESQNLEELVRPDLLNWIQQSL
jgi:hypothetical protein